MKRYGAKLAEPKGPEVGALYSEVASQGTGIEDYWIGTVLDLYIIIIQTRTFVVKLVLQTIFMCVKITTIKITDRSNFIKCVKQMKRNVLLANVSTSFRQTKTKTLSLALSHTLND